MPPPLSFTPSLVSAGVAIVTIDDAYRVLELEVGAPLDDAEQIHRLLVRVWHPDKYERGTPLHAMAEAKLKSLNEARDVLRLAWATTEKRTSTTTPQAGPVTPTTSQQPSPRTESGPVQQASKNPTAASPKSSFSFELAALASLFVLAVIFAAAGSRQSGPSPVRHSYQAAYPTTRPPSKAPIAIASERPTISTESISPSPTHRPPTAHGSDTQIVGIWSMSTGDVLHIASQGQNVCNLELLTPRQLIECEARLYRTGNYWIGDMTFIHSQDRSRRSRDAKLVIRPLSSTVLRAMTDYISWDKYGTETDREPVSFDLHRAN